MNTYHVLDFFLKKNWKKRATFLLEKQEIKEIKKKQTSSFGILKTRKNGKIPLGEGAGVGGGNLQDKYKKTNRKAFFQILNFFVEKHEKKIPKKSYSLKKKKEKICNSPS